MNFIYRLQQFMSGRYGVDRLGWTIIIAALVVSLVNRFVGVFALTIISTLLLIIAFLRMLSRSIYRRQHENDVFMKIWNAISHFFLGIRDRFRSVNGTYNDRKVNVYRECPGCGAKLRLPRRKGHHTAKCPRCGREFKVGSVF